MMLSCVCVFFEECIWEKPLRATDVEFSEITGLDIMESGAGQAEKRRQAQARYREKRRRRINVQFRALSDDATKAPQ